MTTSSILTSDDINLLMSRFNNTRKQVLLLNIEIRTLNTIIETASNSCLPKTSAYFHRLRLSCLQATRTKFLDLAVSLKNRVLLLNC